VSRFWRRYASACTAHFLVQMLVRLIHWAVGDGAIALSPVGRGIARLEGVITQPFVPLLHELRLAELDPFAWVPNSLVWGLALVIVSWPLTWRR
jgi:hypothetical protein